MTRKNKKKFYNSNWFMWIMLIFFAPIGIVLLWSRKDVRFSKKTKGILSVVFTILFISAVAGENETPPDDKLVSTQIEDSLNLQNIEDEKENQSEIENKEEKSNTETEETVEKTASEVTDDIFEGYRLIEVDGGNLSGYREPNVVVDIGFGDRKYYAFTNEYGQLVKVIAKEIILQSTSEPLKSNGRYYLDEAKVPGTESTDLDEGHIIADSLGGVANAYNITPQNSTLNRHGDQAYMEKVIRDAGGCTDFVAIITYPNTTTQIPSH